MLVRVVIVRVVQMAIQQVWLGPVVIVIVVQHRVRVINVVPILINMLVVAPVIAREAERLVVENIRVVIVVRNISGAAVLVHIVEILTNMNVV